MCPKDDLVPSPGLLYCTTETVIESEISRVMGIAKETGYRYSTRVTEVRYSPEQGHNGPPAGGR